jgi:hypothetical protein
MPGGTASRHVSPCVNGTVMSGGAGRMCMGGRYWWGVWVCEAGGIRCDVSDWRPAATPGGSPALW